jgi:hypothetical protein
MDYAEDPQQKELASTEVGEVVMRCATEEECNEVLEQIARRFLEELDKLLRGARNDKSR